MDSWGGAARQSAAHGPLRLVAACLVVATAFGLAACEVEQRHVGSSPPESAPMANNDQRGRFYGSNRYAMSEGGRMFHWFGCDGCHTDPVAGYLNLADRAWRQGGSIPEIYRSIAQGAPGMPAYVGRITPEQTWQLAGYVHGLVDVKPDQRRRNANAQTGEPSASTWRGPL